MVRNFCAKPSERAVSDWNLCRELVVFGVAALIDEADPDRVKPEVSSWIANIHSL